MKRFLPLFTVSALALAALGASFPYVTLNQKTNRLSDNGTAFTRDGVPISGTIPGTVSNSVVSAGLLAVDATKTNGVAATFAMVTNALGYFPATNSALANYVLKAGDTMSGTLGFSGTSTLLNLPSLTTAQKGAATVQAGSLVYDSDLGRVQAFDGSAWHSRVRLDGDQMTGMLTNNAGFAITNDVFLARDAANTLAQRNGANAQAFNVYNTYTDASNYERMSLYFTSNVGLLRVQNAGTGTPRELSLQAATITLKSETSIGRWTIDATALTPNVGIDLGKTASPVRDGWFSRALYSKYNQDGNTKVCTSAVSNALFYVSVPNTNMVGGRVLYTVNSTDGTDSQQITGDVKFGAVGKSTTVTANITDVQNTSTVSAGTLTASLTANVSTNNVFALMVTPTTSLTTTNLTIKWRLETPSTYTVNPL